MALMANVAPERCDSLKSLEQIGIKDGDAVSLGSLEVEGQ